MALEKALETLKKGFERIEMTYSVKVHTLGIWKIWTRPPERKFSKFKNGHLFKDSFFLLKMKSQFHAWKSQIGLIFSVGCFRYRWVIKLKKDKKFIKN